ncbi:MAG: hypothetical protein IH605_13440 [Burkholderiales bacterium]|nr:hypothetical protein [Burkholderiales bacterium]
MKIRKLLVAGVMGFVLSAGLVQAKTPVAPPDDPGKANDEVEKAKNAEAEKQEAMRKAEAAKQRAAELLSKAQDRAVENYKKSHAMSGKPAMKK